MELEEIAALNLKEGDVVELGFFGGGWHPSTGQERAIQLGYFRELVEKAPEELDAAERERFLRHHEEPPYLVICEFREKHGVLQGRQEYRIEDIKWMAKIGPSATDEKHSFT